MFISGDYIKMAMVKCYGRNHLESLWQLLTSFSKDLSFLSVRTILIRPFYLYLYDCFSLLLC